eukprot:scaffold50381_cov71-Phaeocystis_antarctica.AAC.1
MSAADRRLAYGLLQRAARWAFWWERRAARWALWWDAAAACRSRRPCLVLVGRGLALWPPPAAAPPSRPPPEGVAAS